jgi:PST family polysaccharide transporter
MATVQRASITRAQTSTLFWINLAAGGMLSALCAAIAPILAAFYHEPRVSWVTVVTGAAFFFDGLSAQHRAILQRDMRFAVLTLIDILSLFVNIVLGIGMAVAGLGYWALVGMNVCLPAVHALGVWVAGGWIPGPPRRTAGVLAMLRYGGAVTLNNFIGYFAFNTDKVLLGRFWGAEALGIYGRAYQLINMPTENLNLTIGLVAFPALSRVQNDSERLRSYFLKGYGLFLSLVTPITIGCALFGEDIILVFLGPKWGAAMPIFRLLAPTILAFALMRPVSWLLLATDRAARNLKIGLVVASAVILGALGGLSHGPQGVAAGLSITSVLLVVPVISWAMYRTEISALDALRVAACPFLSAMIGAGATVAFWSSINLLSSALLRLIAGNSIFFGAYTIILWFVMGQKAVYLGLLRDLGVWPFAPRRRRADSL